MMSLAAGIEKAGSTDTEKLIAAFSGLKVEAPFGKVEYRAIDHQSTMGAYVGKIEVKNGKGVMSDYGYVDGAKVLPSDDEVKKLRRPIDERNLGLGSTFPGWEMGRAGSARAATASTSPAFDLGCIFA